MTAVDDVLRAFSYLALGYFGLLTVCYLAITLVSGVHYIRHASRIIDETHHRSAA